MRKIIAAVLAICIVGGALPSVRKYAQENSLTASALTDDDGNEYVYIYEFGSLIEYRRYSDHIEVSRYSSEAEGEAVIPGEIDGLPVTSIGEKAFEDCSGLTSITIPESVSKIGQRAFEGCSGISTITIPYTVTSIGAGAFLNCTSLASIEVSDNNDYFTSVEGVLYNKKLTSVLAYPNGNTSKEYVIPDTVTSIGEFAFGRSKNLTSITIPETVTSIGKSAFANCKGLESIAIPASVTVIDRAVFGGCTALSSVTVPDSLTSIGELAFTNCDSLKTFVIPGQVTEIGKYAFYHCDALESVTISDSVKSIGACAFAESKSLASVFIPDSVTSLGEAAFGACTALESVSLSGSLTTIDRGVFENCTSLVTVIIPDSVTSIGQLAFHKSGLRSITLPETVTSIGGAAFAECSCLESIDFMNSSCEIDDDPASICSTYDEKSGTCTFNGIIRGYDGSTAQAYAEKYGYTFELSGEIQTEIESDLRGDANLDNNVNIADAVLVMQVATNPDKYAQGKSELSIKPQGEINADVDGKKGLSNSDALLIQKFKLGLIDKL